MRITILKIKTRGAVQYMQIGFECYRYARPLHVSVSEARQPRNFKKQCQVPIENHVNGQDIAVRLLLI